MKNQKAVVKIGSNLLTRTGYGIDRENLSRMVEAIAGLCQAGVKTVIVSSGAIACGLETLGIKRKPRDLATLQAAASVGQSKLVEMYAAEFEKRGIKVGQVLLTRADFLSRETYVSAQRTMEKMLSMGVIPVVNENDAVAVEEIKFGDNDTLAALVSVLVNATHLFLLSNVEGLMKDPSDITSIIREVNEITPEIFSLARPEKSFYGTGGMQAKLNAARIACCAGVETYVLNGYKPELMLKALQGEPAGTRFVPARKVSSRKHWIAFVMEPKGKIIIDSGAVKALVERKKSLLPAGVKGVEGSFSAGDAVLIVDEQGNEIAKGVTSYDSAELEKIKGRTSSEIAKIFGNDFAEEVVHRDRMAILASLK